MTSYSKKLERYLLVDTPNEQLASILKEYRDMSIDGIDLCIMHDEEVLHAARLPKSIKLLVYIIEYHNVRYSNKGTITGITSINSLLEVMKGDNDV